MTTESVSFAGTNQNPFTAIPVGWTSVGTWRRLTSLNGIKGEPHGKMLFNTYSGGLRKITAQMYYNSGTSTSVWTLLFCNSSLTGFTMNVNDTSVTLVKRLSDVSGATIATVSVSNTADAPFDLEYDDTTGAITVKKNGSSILTGNYTDTPNLLAGIRSYQEGAGHSFRTVAIEYTPAQTITSINSGNPITAGQTGIPIVATGFTAKPTGVTATYASGAKSITATVDSGGTATNFNISIQDRIEAEDWPVNGDTLTFTFTYLSESASGTQTLVKKASETVLTVSGGITIDPATWTYWLTQDGFTVEGGEHDYIPYGDLVLTADGGGSATDAGTFTSWFRPATGTGAGNVYAYTWVITENGVVIGGGITSSGLTSSGLTIAGLTSAGL